MDAVLSQNFNYSVEGLENIVSDTAMWMPVYKHTYAAQHTAKLCCFIHSFMLLKEENNLTK